MKNVVAIVTFYFIHCKEITQWYNTREETETEQRKILVEIMECQGMLKARENKCFLKTDVNGEA